jgi:thiamine pyrophosphate-dependent acetolactate synthase large subunit-like protein
VNRLKRREVVKVLLHNRGELLVVAGLGAPAYDLAAAGGENPMDFPLWGGMGGAAMLGMGLAMAQPNHQVLVLTGDGEMLMGLGSLATIATQGPKNLHILVLDNEAYGETGDQPTQTGMGLDLVAVAKSCGFRRTSVVTELAEAERLRSEIHTEAGPSFSVVKVEVEKLPRVLPARDGVYLTHRMREALLGRNKALED